MWIIPLIALALGAGMTLVVVARRGPQQVRFSLRVAPSRFQVAIPGQRFGHDPRRACGSQPRTHD